MPYISKDYREEYDYVIDELISRLYDKNNDKLSGHLNYIFFRLACNVCSGVGASYARMAVVSSALSEAQAEFRRRVMAPYEDKKIEENGDVELSSQL